MKTFKKLEVYILDCFLIISTKFIEMILVVGNYFLFNEDFLQNGGSSPQ